MEPLDCRRPSTPDPPRARKPPRARDGRPVSGWSVVAFAYSIVTSPLLCGLVIPVVPRLRDWVPEMFALSYIRNLGPFLMPLSSLVFAAYVLVWETVRSPRVRGRGYAVAGMIVSVLSMLCWVGLLFWLQYAGVFRDWGR